MKDYIVRATAAGGTVRAFAAVTTEIAREAAAIHSLSPVAAAALGRTLTAAAIMSQTLKSEKDKLTVQIKGSGPLGGIVVASDSKANVRGYVYNPEVDLPLNQQGKLDVGGAVGKRGYMNVIKDLGLKEPYIGFVNLISGEIGEDIAYYYAFSEQVPSVVSLGTLIGAGGEVINSGGYIIQLMPGAEEEIVQYLEKKVAEMPPVTTLYSEGKKPEDILEMIFEGKELNISGTAPCMYECNCSKDRMERNLISLGVKEVQEILDEQGEAELQCHFCNSKYQFTGEELQSLLDEMQGKR